jgi:metal-dependent amidase/aminoacylase/carboxypeptidase family protein
MRLTDKSERTTDHADFTDFALRVEDRSLNLFPSPSSFAGNFEPFRSSATRSTNQQRISGCFSFLGISVADWETRHSVHQPLSKVDENAPPIGAAWHTQIILDSLAKPGLR